MNALDTSPLLISLKTSVAATLLTFVVGLAVARLAMRLGRKSRGVVDGLLMLPMVLPPTVVGFFLLLLLGKRSPLGQAFASMGLPLIFSWPATVVAATAVSFPLMYRMSVAAFEQVDPDMVYAARTLGASEWRIFRTIIIPLAWPGVLAGTVLSFSRALGEFGATLMLAGNIPGTTQTIPMAIFFLAEGGNPSGAFTWVAVVLVISLATTAAATQLSASGVSRPWTTVPPTVPRGGLLPHAPDAPDDFELRLPSPPPHAAAARNQPRLEIAVNRRLDGFALDIAVSTGEPAVALLGASGSGKSLTLRAVAGIEKPDRGRVVLGGTVVFDSASGVDVPTRARGVGYLFQNHALFPHMSVAENLAYGLATWSLAARQERVREVLALVHLEPLADRLPRQLSGGQQQRAALARALAPRPRALLLDEPFSALDPHLRTHLQMQLLAALGAYEGVAVLVTHELEEAYRLCQDVVLVDAGRVLAQAPRETLFRRPATVAVARFTGCKNISPVRRNPDGTWHALAWGVDVRVAQQQDDATHAGIRAHHLRLTRGLAPEHGFACTVAATVETPHRVTAYIALGDGSHVLQAEVFKHQWQTLAEAEGPWFVQLNHADLFLLRG